MLNGNLRLIELLGSISGYFWEDTDKHPPIGKAGVTGSTFRISSFCCLFWYLSTLKQVQCCLVFNLSLEHLYRPNSPSGSGLRQYKQHWTRVHTEFLGDNPQKVPFQTESNSELKKSHIMYYVPVINSPESTEGGLISKKLFALQVAAWLKILRLDIGQRKLTKFRCNAWKF